MKSPGPNGKDLASGFGEMSDAGAAASLGACTTCGGSRRVRSGAAVHDRATADVLQQLHHEGCHLQASVMPGLFELAKTLKNLQHLY